MSKTSTRSLSLLLITIFIAFMAPLKASAVDVPLLTWERGKQQSIVLGGPVTSNKWKIQLVGQGIEPIVFTGSVKNANGFYVYSINIPNSLPLGAYTVQTNSYDGSSTVVAGISMIERKTYAIRSIPTDLALIITLFVILTTSLSVLRGRKYSNLAFKRRYAAEDENWFIRFRHKRLTSTGNSLARYIAHRDGEFLNSLSSTIWALAPWIGLVYGAAMAVQVQFTAPFPHGPITLFIIAAVIGAIDATAGYGIAIGFAFVQIGFGDVTSLRELFALAAFSMAWFAPAMFTSTYLLTLGKDFGQKFKDSQFAQLFTVVLSVILGSSAVVISNILTDSLVINRQSEPILRWPLTALVAVILIARNLVGNRILIRREHQVEELYLARIISPGVANSLAFAIFGIIYVWTNSFAIAGIGAVIIALPYVLLFVAFPEFGWARLAKSGRNAAIEVFLIGALTTGAYYAIQLAPAAVATKSQAFILLGLVPVLIHSIYSVLHASAEKKFKEEINA